jgi:hypothetical protein
MSSNFLTVKQTALSCVALQPSPHAWTFSALPPAGAPILWVFSFPFPTFLQHITTGLDSAPSNHHFQKGFILLTSLWLMGSSKRNQIQDQKCRKGDWRLRQKQSSCDQCQGLRDGSRGETQGKFKVQIIRNDSWCRQKLLNGRTSLGRCSCNVLK